MRERCKNLDWSAGIDLPNCNKGVDIKKLVKGKKTGILRIIPCFSNNKASCPHEHFPTPEEIEERKKKLIERMSGISQAIKTISDKHDIKPDFSGAMKSNKGYSGIIQCPVCGKNLSYTVAPGNNHIWGSCETDGCLRWMQ